MPPLASEWPWADYIFHPFPILSSSKYTPRQVGRIEFTQTLHPNLHNHGIPWQHLLWAAIVKLTSLYVDAPEFIFAEIHGKQPISIFKAITAEIQQDSASWADLSSALRDLKRHRIPISRARAALNLADSANPYPVAVVWDGLTPGLVDVDGTAVVIEVDTQNEDGGNIVIALRWNHLTLSPDAAEIFAKQVLALFDVAATDPSQTANTLGLDPTLNSIIEANYDPEEACCATDWLVRNAAEHPDAIAHEIYSSLSSPPRLVTYAELNDMANRFAHWLLSNGLEFEDRVALCRPRDLQFYVAQAAIFKSGGCYVSIDPELPEERKRHITEDSDAKFILTNDIWFKSFRGSVYSLDSVKTLEEIASQDSSEVSLAKLDSLAYLLYTSGTTGKPKGCLLNHRGIYWAIKAMCEYPRGVTNPATDKRLAMASVAFDVHISEICQVWSLGIRLVSAPRFEMLADLQDNIIRLGITHLGMVPSMIEATLSAPEDLPLKYLVSGGEKISDAVLETWADNPTIILANFYGPTEATIGCVSRKVSAKDRKENIGRPFPACSAYIVNSKMDILPLGVAGELVIGGPLVARGYHNLQEVTAKSFKEWPRKGCRAYRTGDLVRMTAEGTLLILGRIDSQIKLRGVRIESEGVSEVVRKSANGKTSAHTFISLHPELGNEILVSFFANDDPLIKVDQKRTSTPKVLPDRSEDLVLIRRAVQTELAVYMRPSHIIPLDFLPLTLNGKTDGKKLLGVFQQTPLEELMKLQRSGAQSQPTRAVRVPTDVELKVISIVSRICGLPESQISPASNLFECGFDSLKFSALTRALRGEFMTSALSVTSIMQSPAIEAIAKGCSVADAEDVAKEAMDLTWLDDFSKQHQPSVQQIFQENDVEQVLPTLPIQDGILAQSVQFKNLYVQHFLYRLKEGANLDRLESAWRKVAQRQGILRVVFVLGAETLQVVLSPHASPLPWTSHNTWDGHDISKWFEAEEGPRIAGEINDDITTPLFRLNLYRSPHSSYLAVSIHHALYDGLAFPLLMREVDAVYRAQRLQNAVPFAQVIHNINAVSRGDRAKAFWVSEFEDADVRDRPLNQRNEREVVRYAKVLDASLQDLRSRCSAMHVTLEALFTGAITYLGQRFLGWSNDAIFGIIHSGRISDAIDLNSAVAPLVSVVPLRVRLRQGEVADYIQSCQSSITNLIPYEHVPLGTIQRWLGVTALVDVLFSVREEIPANDYECFEYVQSRPPPPEFPVVFEIVVNTANDTIELRSAVAVNEEVTKTVRQLVDDFESCVTYLSESPEADLSLPDASGQLTSGWPVRQPRTQEAEEPADPEIVRVLLPELSAFLRIPVDSVREGSSLLSLGLDSLKAITLSHRLRERGISVSPMDIIRAGSVRGIASASVAEKQQKNISQGGSISELDQLLRKDIPVEAVRLGKEDRVEITAATALQAGMLSQTVASSGQLYVHSFTFKLQPQCRIELLNEAWRTSVGNLDILRTSFHFSVELGRWAQVVHSALDFKWSTEERESIDNAAKEFITGLGFGAEDALHHPPVHLRHVSSGGDYLIVVLHHALYDGISLPMLFDYVKAAYTGNPPSTVQFHTISRWITSLETQATGYWGTRLKGVHPWAFPREISSPANAWRASKVVNLPKGVIDRFCRRYEVSAQSIAQASWAKVLAICSKRLDVVYGQVVSGRTVAGTEKVIGPVFNTIPCWVTIGERQTSKDLVRSVHKLNLEALPWHHASLRLIQRALNTTSLCDTLFLFQPNTQYEAEQDPLWTVASRPDEKESKSQYAINVEIHQHSDSWVIHSSCSAAVMDIGGLEETLTMYGETITQMVNRPGDRVMPSDFSPVEAHIPGPSTDGDSTCEGSDWKEDSATITIRGLLSRFSKLPEDLIRGTTSLASMGIDSITALQISSLARQQGIFVSPVTIIQSANVHELMVKIHAEYIEETSGTDSSATPPPAYVEIPPPLADVIRTTMPRHLRQYIEAIYPVSPGMEWMIGAWQNSDGCRYQHAFVQRVRGRVEIRRLEQSWDALLRLHPILRSTFCPVPAFKGNSDHLLALCLLDTLPGNTKRLARRKLARLHSEEQALVAEARMSVTYPAAAPGMHARLTVLEGKHDTYLLLNLHHFQYDAGNLPFLIRHLEAIYLGLDFHCETNLGSHLRSLIPTSPKRQIQEKYWREVFPSGWQPSFFTPPSSSRKKTRTNYFFRGIVSSSKELDEMARKSGLTPQAILLAAWARVHSLECSMSDATFGMWHSSRFADNLAVPCLNLLPMRVTDATRSTLEVARELMKDLQRRSGTLEQSRLRDVSKWAGSEGKPLCNVYVNVLHTGPRSGDNTARVFEPVKLPYRALEAAKENNQWKGAFCIPEVQDDVMIEIFFDNAKDSIGMSIESSILTEPQSERLASEWGKTVMGVIARGRESDG